MFRRPGPDGPVEREPLDSQSRQGGTGAACARFFDHSPAGAVVGVVAWMLRVLLGPNADPFASTPAGTLDMYELARRLGLSAETLECCMPAYRVFHLPKRSGGRREIAAPDAPLKALQRQVLRRVLARLRAHASAKGFERGESIVTNARVHRGRAVVLSFDIKDFFASTDAQRVTAYLRRIGWDRQAANWLTKICTRDGGLPAGAPTSPRLANLVNQAMDARLAGLARRFGATYTRYADDLTFSLPQTDERQVAALIGSVRVIVREYGYKLHQRRKLRIRRAHQQQRVTGLVVNEAVNLPRQTRRRLRAIEHHLRTGRPATLTPAQYAGWAALRHMVDQQRRAAL